MWASPQATGTVVVGCDGSWESQNAVVSAAFEASARRTGLVLLAVAKHRPYWPDSLAWVARAEAESSRHACAVAEHALAYVVATHPTLAVHTVVVAELDSPELADVARHAGLLVLGRRGDRGQVAFSMGSTSAELARRFHCPMLVVHDRGRPSAGEPVARDRAVVVGMDVAAGVTDVLAVAVIEAVTRDLPLVVVHTLERGKDGDRAVVAEGWRRCQAVLRQAQLPAGVPNRLVITQDDPAQAMLHRVGPGDLLVVGTHGDGRLAGLVAGSVSREVLDNMTCDVMVVQPDLASAEPVPDEARAGSSQAPVASTRAGVPVAPDPLPWVGSSVIPGPAGRR